MFIQYGVVVFFFNFSYFYLILFYRKFVTGLS